jgi:hypothetical protein
VACLGVARHHLREHARVEARGDLVIAAGREGGRPKSPWPPPSSEEGDNTGRQAGASIARPVCAALHPDGR